MSLSWMFWCRIYTNFLACLISTDLKLQLQKSTFDTQIVLWPGSQCAIVFFDVWISVLSHGVIVYLAYRNYLWWQKPCFTWLPHGYHMATTWLLWLTPLTPRDSQGSPLARPRSRIEKVTGTSRNGWRTCAKSRGRSPSLWWETKWTSHSEWSRHATWWRWLRAGYGAGNVLVSLSELWSSWSPKCVQNVNFREAQEGSMMMRKLKVWNAVKFRQVMANLLRERIRNVPCSCVGIDFHAGFGKKLPRRRNPQVQYYDLSARLDFEISTESTN